MSLMEDRAYQYLVDEMGNGGLTCELDRSPMVDRPVIVIGLGGTGIDAMLQVKYAVQRKIKAPEGKKTPGRIAFLGIDTDEYAFRNKRVGDVRVDPSEQVLIDEPKIAMYMQNPDLIPHDYQRDWLSKRMGIAAKLIIFGTGGIRQFGRFMLICKAQQVIDKILRAAEAAWSAGKEDGREFRPDTAYTVYILTGICGGTGSGIFLDVAYLVQHLFKENLKKDAEIRGFIFMPDVSLSKIPQPETRDALTANGYAALRELDFWMNYDRVHSFVQQYTPELVVNTKYRPFDYCFMISPNADEPADYYACMKNTSEMLMNMLIAAEPGSRLEFDSVFTQLPALLTSSALKTPCSANYIYTSMGMAQQRMPLDATANYLGFYLLSKVQEMYDNQPTKEQVEDFFKKDLRLDYERGLWRQFDKTIPTAPFSNVVRSLDDFKRAIDGYKHADVLNSDRLERELSEWVLQCEAVYNSVRDDLLNDCMEALKSRLEGMFVNPEFGPYWAHKMLHNSEVGEPDILKRLKEEYTAVAAFLNSATDRRNALKRQMDEAKETARRNRFVPLVAGSKYNDYVEAAFKYYNHIRKEKFANIAYEFYTRMLKEVVDYNNNVLERFSELLNHLTAVFKSNTEIIINVNNDPKSPSWNIPGSFGKIRETVDAARVNLKNSGKENALISEFLHHMLRDRKMWVGDEENLGRSFSRFVSEKFHALMNQTIEQTYMEMNNLTSAQQLADHIETVVMPELDRSAKVSYPVDDQLYPLYNAPQRSVICVPSAAVNIMQAVRNYGKNRGISCYEISSSCQSCLS